MKEKIESLVYAIVPIGIFFVIPNMIAIVFYIFGGGDFIQKQPFLFTLIGYAFILLTLRKLEKIYPVSNSLGELKKGMFDPANILLGIGFGFLLWAFSAFLNLILFPFFPNYGEEISVFFNRDQLFVNALVIVLVGPIVEEVIFRDKIYKRLEESFGPSHAIFIQALLFGFVHSIALQKIYTTVLGMGLGYVRHKKNSLIIPVLAHMTINAIGFILAQSL
jgi:membrane protease YdiL (CAAX protease family)